MILTHVIHDNQHIHGNMNSQLIPFIMNSQFPKNDMK